MTAVMFHSISSGKSSCIFGLLTCNQELTCLKVYEVSWSLVDYRVSYRPETIFKKLVWRTDRQTECKPIVPSGFTGGGLITMRHDLDLWPFDLKINRAHPWLMVSKCMKFHDHWLITESVIVRKPFSNNHAPWPWPLTFWPQNQ